MSSKEVAVKIDHLTKKFRIPLESSNGIKQKLINVLKGRKGYRDFTPLKNISFEIEKGDFFGIVGRNGSGKSTLLKTIAGIYSPNKGSIKVNGKLVPFIELGVGFNPELTGRENVFLNGALLGFSREEMEKMYDDIVSFAELEDFMDERLKNYSSGMQVRLAFSIAIRADGDILLLDEVLAVGDEAFQRKCYRYFDELKRDKKTVILVTHDMGAVDRYCNKAIMIEKGKIVVSGTNKEAADAYRELFINDAVSKVKSEVKATDLVSDVKVSIKDDANNIAGRIEPFKPFKISMEYNYNDYDIDGSIGVSIKNLQGMTLIATGTGTFYDDTYIIKKGHNSIEILIEQNILTNDDYFVDIAVAKGVKTTAQSLIYQQSNAASFAIRGIVSRPNSIMHPKVKIIT